jgi:hypothetical protein
MNDVLDGFVALMIGGFEFAVGLALPAGFVMEEAVGEGVAEALVEEQEQELNLDTFCGQTVGVASAIAL